jgi:hypothetical protein
LCAAAQRQRRREQEENDDDEEEEERNPERSRTGGKDQRQREGERGREIGRRREAERERRRVKERPAAATRPLEKSEGKMATRARVAANRKRRKKPTVLLPTAWAMSLSVRVCGQRTTACLLPHTHTLAAVAARRTTLPVPPSLCS